ncbi:unnamed protein product [Closterium sp. NIES-53]
MCIDYRALNRVTVKSRYPISRADELIDQLRITRVFSKIDLRGRYHQVRVEPSDYAKISFHTRYRSSEYTVMPFGLTNAPDTPEQQTQLKNLTSSLNATPTATAVPSLTSPTTLFYSIPKTSACPSPQNSAPILRAILHQPHDHTHHCPPPPPPW